MKNKIDKSLEEVWEMKDAARERFHNSGYSNYGEYLRFRQQKIDEYLTKQINEKIISLAS